MSDQDDKEVFMRATGASPRRLGKQIILAVANNTRSWGKEKTHTDIDAFGVPQKRAMLCYAMLGKGKSNR